MINIQCLIFYQAAKLQNLFRNLWVKIENNCSVWQINPLFLSKTFETFLVMMENKYNFALTKSS